MGDVLDYLSEKNMLAVRKRFTIAINLYTEIMYTASEYPGHIFSSIARSPFMFRQSVEQSRVISSFGKDFIVDMLARVITWLAAKRHWDTHGGENKYFVSESLRLRDWLVDADRAVGRIHGVHDRP